MTATRETPSWARAGRPLFGILFVGLLSYWTYTFFFDASDESIRRRFRPAARTESSGHSSFSLPASSHTTRIAQQLVNLEPGQAGWESEVVSADIDKQLKRLSQQVESRDESTFAEIAADPFTGQILPQEALQTIFDDDNCQAQRLPKPYGNFQETTSLRTQLSSLMGSGKIAGNLRCSFKVAQIQVRKPNATSRLLFQIIRQTDAAVEQSNAVLESSWEITSGTPRLRSLKILEFDRIVLFAEGRRLFDDVTAAVFSNTSENGHAVFEEQVLRGVGYWSERLSAIDDMNIYGHHGLATADVNQDGLADIYVCDSGGLPNRLYVQRPDGTLKDVSRESNIDWLESTSSALLIDLDNDGDPDLVAATVAGMILASNDGRGIFTIRAAHPGIAEAQSLCAADYDNDGDLDLYLTIYGPGGSAKRARGFEASAPIPYSDANNGGANLMFENQGEFQFFDVTKECGLDNNNRRFSFAAAWEDFDVDGDMDLYVANDFGRNNLYVNDGGKFRDLAAELSVEDMAGGMSVSWGDFNQDAAMDIYVGNMYSAAGNRVTFQRRFLETRSPDQSAGIQRMARGNTLFMARPDSRFADVSENAGVTMGRWAWSSKFADLNNDGREDLVVANGYFSNTKSDDL